MKPTFAFKLFRVAGWGEEEGSVNFVKYKFSNSVFYIDLMLQYLEYKY